MFILVRLEIGITPAIEYLDLAMFVAQDWTFKENQPISLAQVQKYV